ncbi:MAG: 2-dehydro-3-deoxy-6-phosphogalactonate aldolase [Gammaproteobacteria bacterium]|nr:2-dehydro-3-deoxy-6-phosphogalactonate aldolase [Gammaproteobacteria bacterium]
MDFDTALSRLPLIAILRGMPPNQANDVGDLLHEAGFTMVEATMNSPQPLTSIRRLADTLGNTMLVGAGTVLTAAEVRAAADAGARLIVSPNTNAEVIRETRRLGLISVPGVFTPSEAFAALAAGASALKLFPADALPPSAIRAWQAVLPDGVPMLVTGGVTLHNLGDYLSAGARGAGIGSALYTPGKSITETRAAAAAFANACRQVTGSC